jgi:hypothetical protein
MMGRVTGRHVMVHWAGQLGQVGRREKVPDRVVGHDGLEWHVEEVIDVWRNQAYIARGQVPYGEIAEMFLLRVTGPAPWQPTGTAQQRVRLWQYGTGSGWWMDTAEGDPDIEGATRPLTAPHPRRPAVGPHPRIGRGRIGAK